MAHLSVKQRSPFRKSLTPSRRHSRHTALRYLATPSSPHRPDVVVGGGKPSDSAPLWRAAAVVRDGGDVADGADHQPGGGKRADGGLASGAGPFHAHLDRLHPVLVAGRARGVDS